MADSYSSSSSAYSDSAHSEIQFPRSYYHHKEEKSRKRRPQTVAKDKIMKKPIAPWPRTPPKVYNVAPVNFRDVVQKLTGAPEFQPTLLHEAAPLPHEWFPVLAEHTVDAASSAEDQEQQLTSPLALSVSSPPQLAWSSYVLMSP